MGVPAPPFHPQIPALRDVVVEVLDDAGYTVWRTGPHTRWRMITVDFVELGLDVAGRYVWACTRSNRQ